MRGGATGNHYLLDAVAGFAVVFLAMVTVGAGARLIPHRRRPEVTVTVMEDVDDDVALPADAVA